MRHDVNVKNILPVSPAQVTQQEKVFHKAVRGTTLKILRNQSENCQKKKYSVEKILINLNTQKFKKSINTRD